MNDLKKKRIERWAWVCGWTALTYGTLYIVRPICEFLKVTTPFSLLVNLLLFATLGFVIFSSIRIAELKKKYTLSLLLIALVAYVFGFVSLKIPEEKIHLIEYGILAFLTLRAVSVDLKGKRSYILTLAIVSLIGWGDEGIQHLLPNRYYQIEDVLLNCISACLGLYLTFIIQRENELLR